MSVARHQFCSTSPSPERSPRHKMLGAIHIEWHKQRPDLHLDKEGEREERLQFITEVLKLKRPLRSMRSLTDSELCKVLDALRLRRGQPRLNGYTPPVKPEPEEKVVHHLASAEQVFTIRKLFENLEWTEGYRQRFLDLRFQRENPAHLTPRQANSLVMILLNIAASRELKEQGQQRVSRAEIGKVIPAIKARLGIDRAGNQAAKEVAHGSSDTD
ncbi:MAG: hypothetical protein ACRD9R_08905 [Pyrinomonadaceae bacterium]